MQNKSVAVEFTHFGFRYKSQSAPTLFDINLTIYKGEKVLILGSSGSGKTTLAHCINGLIPFSYPGEMTGSVKVSGVESGVGIGVGVETSVKAGAETREMSVFKLSAAVGTVLQDSDAQFVGLSVGEDIAFSLENRAVPRETMLRSARERSARVGLEGFLTALPFNLSGGQKQKAALGGVIDEKTAVFIFDEPLAALDPTAGGEAITLIDDIVRTSGAAAGAAADAAAGAAALIIEHRLEECLSKPLDRIVLMDKGRIVCDLPPADFLKTTFAIDYGIREPLYISAMKTAGCALSAYPTIHDIESVTLRDEDKSKIRLTYLPDNAEGLNHTAAQRPLGRELIRVENVSFNYEGSGHKSRPAIADASFTVREGERIAFIGKNGAGKSTVAKLLTGICRPDRGAIFLDGVDLKKLTVKEISLKLGYVMQNPNQMIVKDTIKDEVELAPRLRGMPPETMKEKTERALTICELYRMRNWPVSTVSYGQKKRVTIAGALSLDPAALILDEPTAGQDYRHYHDIISFINTLNAGYGKTIIFITHDLHLAIENTDRAIVFADGRIIADGDIFSILTDENITRRANLKKTSLHTLAEKAGLAAEPFIRSFIRRE